MPYSSHSSSMFSSSAKTWSQVRQFCLTVQIKNKDTNLISLISKLEKLKKFLVWKFWRENSNCIILLKSKISIQIFFSGLFCSVFWKAFFPYKPFLVWQKSSTIICKVSLTNVISLFAKMANHVILNFGAKNSTFFFVIEKSQFWVLKFKKLNLTEINC